MLQKSGKKGLTASCLLAPQCRTLPFPSASACLPLARVPLVLGAAVWRGGCQLLGGKADLAGREGEERKLMSFYLNDCHHDKILSACPQINDFFFFFLSLCCVRKGEANSYFHVWHEQRNRVVCPEEIHL